MGKCRELIVVYKAIDLKLDKYYSGCTQQFKKLRIQQHVAEVKDKLFKGKSSDTFAKHFSKYIPEDALRTA